MVDDEETLLEAMRFNLEIEGYEVDTATSASEALSRDIAGYDLLLLDVMMDGMSGFELAHRLKASEATASVPVIFCTARDSEDDEVSGLTLGADDYITKPFTVRTLLARVRAVLRRADAAPSSPDADKTDTAPQITFKGVKVDRTAQQCTIDGAPVPMPRKELEILALLLQNVGRVFSRDEILSRVWGSGVVVCDRTIDVNITRLRSKLRQYGSHIITRSGYGYGWKA